MQAQLAQKARVEIRRTFKTDVQSVFDALTQPERLVHWWGVSSDHETHIREVDLRVGGRYRLGMRSSDGEAHVVGGEYTEVIPGRRLAFTWRWEHSAEDYPTTHVLIDLQSTDNGCLMTLVHQGFPDDEQAAMHNEGWNACLDRLPEAIDG